MIYFITEARKEYVKIGYTTQPIKQRLSALQTANPYELIVCDVIEGDMRQERSLHHWFKDEHHRGEWYRFSDRIKRFLRTIGTNSKRIPKDISSMSRDEILEYMREIGMWEHLQR